MQVKSHRAICENDTAALRQIDYERSGCPTAADLTDAKLQEGTTPMRLGVDGVKHVAS